MTVEPAAPKQDRRGLYLIGGGCAVLALCACVAAVSGGGYLWFNQREPARGDQPAVEYILDASPRMALPAAGADSDATRLAVAQGVLAEIVRPAAPDVTAGLRVFGNGAVPVACQDTNLLVPLAPANQGQISDQALALQAGAAADAALAEAMIAAIRDLSDPAGPHSLVVVTGGADSCNPEAGELIAREAENAGIDLQLFVVGFQVPAEDLADIKGTVEDGGGTYFNAYTEEELRAILDAIQTYVDEDTVELLDRVLALATPEALATTVAEATQAATAIAAATVTPSPVPGEATATPLGATAVPTEATANAGGYQPQTACDHPYFPLRLGATWQYSSEFGTYTWSVTEVSGDLDNATATLNMAMTDVSLSYHWTCTRAGILSYDYGNVGVSGAEGVDFEVVSSEGVWLLPVEQLLPGTAWTHSYAISASSEGGSVTTFTSQNLSVTGLEAIESVAGTVESVRLDGTSVTVINSVGLAGTEIASSFTYWLAYGVGMVQSVSTSDSSSSTTTLVSYSIP
jgi:hypothetical protein